MRFVSLILCVTVVGGCSRLTASSTLPPGLPQDASATTNARFKSLYKFGGPDGAKPFADLLVVHKTLYGTTLFGGNSSACGAEGCGTVFEVSPHGTEKVIYSFQGNADGENPFAGLTKINGVFYGTTQAGGANNDGTVFAITASGSKRVIYSFKGYPGDGQSPMATLLAVNDKLYGTTEYGGAGYGTVFEITTSGKEIVLYNFQGPPDGANPRASLIEVNGTFYGTTENGGIGTSCLNYLQIGCGTVFSLSASGQETVLYRFVGGPGSDGARPMAGLLDAGSGTLYGTTMLGGANGNGTVFQIIPTGQETVLYSFKGQPDGAYPLAGLTYHNGALFGTTSAGGGSACAPSDDGCGTVFTVSTSGGESILHSFHGSTDGESPVASFAVVNGDLYGTTSEGGEGCSGSGPGCGTIFRISP